MKKSGPDSLNSWAMALVCSFLTMMMYGMTRMSGMLFVASMPRFNVNREKASLPYVLCDFMQSLSGPLVGYLGHKYSLRSVVTFGCLVASVGTGSCFFAESIWTVTFLWGITFGLGFGLSTLILPIVINQHFIHHRATAIGVMYTGSYMGFFILPGIVEQLLNEYGLSGTFLFLSGFLLQCVPAAMLLKKPNFESQKQILNSVGNASSCVSSNNSISKEKGFSRSEELPVAKRKNDPEANLDDRKMHRQYEIAQTGMHTKGEDSLKKILSNGNAAYSDVMARHNEFAEKGKHNHIIEGEFVRDRNSAEFTISDCTFISEMETSDKATFKEIDACQMYHTNSIVPMNLSNGMRGLSVACMNSDKYYDCKKQTADARKKLHTTSKVNESKVNDPIKVNGTQRSIICRLVSDPIFILVAVEEAIYGFCFITFVTIIVDFCRDIDIKMANEKYIIMCFAISSNVSLLSLGWVTDRGYISRTNFAGLCFLSRCVPIFCIPFSTGFPMLITLVSLVGFCEAAGGNLLPLIIADYMAEDVQVIAISSHNFLNGPLYLTISPLVGYFRDKLGSYEYMFYLMGLLSLVCSIGYFFFPCLAKRGKRGETKSTE